MALNLTARLTLQDDLSGRMKNVTRSLSDVESRTKSATSGFTSMGSSIAKLGAAVGITALLAKGVGMIKSSIGSAFDRIDTMERFERTMTTMLGSSAEAKKALEGINEAVTGTAYGLDAGAMAVQNFVSRGIEVGKATKWFEAMGDAVAFYGDGSNEQLESVTAAMAKMATSGKVNMQQMETMTNAGIDAMGMYGKATGQSTDQVRKSLKKGTLDAEEFFDVVTTAMNEGTNGVQKIAGSAKDAGATWAGAFANMKFAVVRGVQTIIMTIDEMLEKNGLPSMRDMVSAFGKAFEKALKSAVKVISPLVKGIAFIIKALKPFAPILKKVAVAVGIAVGAILGFIAVAKILGGIIAIVSSPVLLVVAAIALLVLGFQYLYKNSEAVRIALDGIAGSVKAFFKILSGDFRGAHDILEKAGFNKEQISRVTDFAMNVKKALIPVKEMFEKVSGAVKGFSAILSGDFLVARDILTEVGFTPDQIARITDFAMNVKKAFLKIADVFTAISTGSGGDILTALGLSPELVGNITGLIDTVKTKAGELVTFLSEKWAQLQPGIQILLDAFVTASEFIAEVFTTLLSVLSPIFDALTNAFMIVADIAVIAFDTIIAPAIGFVIDIFKLMWKVVGPVLELLGEAIKVAFDILKVVWDQVIKPVAEYLMGTFKEAFVQAQPHIETLGGAFDKIGELISWATEKLKDFSGWLKGISIPDWVTTVGGKIAGAAEWVGGLHGGSASQSHYHGVNRIKKDGHLARLHRGERVLTRREADEFDQISYEGVTGGATYNNQTYNNVSTTQASKSNQATGGGGVTFSGNTFHVRQESDIDDIADQLYRKINAAGKAGA